MIQTRLWISAAMILVMTAHVMGAGDGNRLAYLEENNPWYPHTGFARRTTPQWVGDEGVEAVVILAIDDMRDPAKYEAYLRPILQRLKAIDGRAPVSIMTCNVKPDDPQLQSWLGEGLSIECHTVDHPCPLLQGGDFENAKSTYDRCVDLLNQIPGTTPVAFRTPCCDSLNTVSPRFFAEIFNARTPGGNFLQMDSSVFCVFTDDDPEIPAELVTDPDGRPKFKKYLPKGLERNGVVHNQFVNWIENYPYPYVINNTCWEFPCMVPSDWEANFYHQPNNPETVRDMQAALDITVLMQGVFCMVFHPHGWIRAEQMVEFIDHAVATHGEKVKFLTFREALARLNENLLKGHSLRDEQGHDNGVRLVDVNDDGTLEVAAAPVEQLDHLSLPARLPAGLQIRDEDGSTAGLRYVDLNGDNRRDIVVSNSDRYGIWLFDDTPPGWSQVLSGARGDNPPEQELPPIVRADGTDNGFFIHSGYLLWQNEDTANLPDMVEKRSIAELLGGETRPPK